MHQGKTCLIVILLKYKNWKLRLATCFLYFEVENSFAAAHNPPLSKKRKNYIYKNRV
jgi:hypothetical protein